MQNENKFKMSANVGEVLQMYCIQLENSLINLSVALLWCFITALFFTFMQQLVENFSPKIRSTGIRVASTLKTL